jgi:hypothetical protein
MGLIDLSLVLPRWATAVPTAAAASVPPAETAPSAGSARVVVTVSSSYSTSMTSDLTSRPRTETSGVGLQLA